MKQLEGIIFEEPFPHLIVNNLYNKEELKLIWEELKFYTRPGKLLTAVDYGGIPDKTNSKALWLDKIYTGQYRKLSNILNVNRKLFTSDILKVFSEISDCCSLANRSNYDVTKVRYYHNDEYYDPHTDASVQYLAFSYFYKEPKKFTGGELLFPKYDYKLTCDNNSVIIMPGWVEHGVSKVSIEDSDYFDGYGRYAITSFFSNKDKKSK